MFLSSVALALCQASAPPPSGLSGTADSAFETLDNGLRYRSVHLPGSRHECLALVFEIGRQHDPRGQTGLAEVVGEVLTLTQEENDPRRFQVAVKDAFTFVWTTVPVGEVEGRLEFLVALMDGSLEPDDDVLDRARARAALRADDVSMIYPGPILRQRAQRSLLAETSLGRQSLGIPAEILKIPLTDIRRRIRDAYGSGAAILGMLGGMPDGDLAGCLDSLRAIPARDQFRPASVTYDPLGPPEETTPHPLVDGPYVSAALRTPAQSSEDFLPFLLAMEILRTRAVRVFGSYRGAEGQARFPFVDYSFMDGDRLAMINRRGEDLSSLEDVQAEMSLFLRGMRDNRISQAMVDAAAETAVQQLALPPYEDRLLGPMVQQSAALMPRALAMCMYELWNWPTDMRHRIRALSRDVVQRALEKCCDPEQLRWFALVPR